MVLNSGGGIVAGAGQKAEKSGFFARIKNGISGLGTKLIECFGTGMYAKQVFEKAGPLVDAIQKDGEIPFDKVGELAGSLYGGVHFAKAMIGKPSKERGMIGTAFNLATTEVLRMGMGWGGSVIEGVKDGVKNNGEPKSGKTVMERETLDTMGVQSSNPFLSDEPEAEY